MKHKLFLLILVSLIASACTPLLGGACPFTQAADLAFVPPEPMPAEAPYEDMFWHGKEALWTMLPKDGKWHDLPQSEDGFGQKLVFWSLGYDYMEESNPTFILNARPLERVSETYQFEQATNMFNGDLGSAILVGVSFPYAGCWEITGSYRGESLSYVMEIVP